MNKTIPTLPSRRRVNAAKDYFFPENSPRDVMANRTTQRFDALLKQHAMEKGNLISLPLGGTFPHIPLDNSSYGINLYAKIFNEDDPEPSLTKIGHSSASIPQRDASGLVLDGEQKVHQLSLIARLGHDRCNALVSKYRQPHLIHSQV